MPHSQCASVHQSSFSIPWPLSSQNSSSPSLSSRSSSPCNLLPPSRMSRRVCEATNPRWLADRRRRVASARQVRGDGERRLSPEDCFSHPLKAIDSRIIRRRTVVGNASLVIGQRAQRSDRSEGAPRSRWSGSSRRRGISSPLAESRRRADPGDTVRPPPPGELGQRKRASGTRTGQFREAPPALGCKRLLRLKCPAADRTMLNRSNLKLRYQKG